VPGKGKESRLREHDGSKQAIPGRIAARRADRCTAVDIWIAGRQVVVSDANPVRDVYPDDRRNGRDDKESSYNHALSITDAYLIYVQDNKRGLI